MPGGPGRIRFTCALKAPSAQTGWAQGVERHSPLDSGGRFRRGLGDERPDLVEDRPQVRGLLGKEAIDRRARILARRRTSSARFAATGFLTVFLARVSAFARGFTTLGTREALRSASLLPTTVRFNPIWIESGLPSTVMVVLPLWYQPNEPVRTPACQR